MKRQEQVQLTMGIYAGAIRRVDFDVAARMVRNGVAVAIAPQPQLLPTEKAKPAAPSETKGETPPRPIGRKRKRRRR